MELRGECFVPKGTVPVTERAVVQRINRKFLAEDGELGRELKKTRGVRAKAEFGDYYILNVGRNFIVGHHVDPEGLARKLGVLANWERLDTDE
jgi:hypothetical protein